MFNAENFNLMNEFNILRIICGAFMIPHSIGKITEWEFSMGFFTKAGFPKPPIWMYASLVFEAVVAICLILGIYTTYAAILGAIFLGVAALACYRVSGHRWYWNFGGSEYCAFWTICCIVVAMHG